MTTSVTLAVGFTLAWKSFAVMAAAAIVALSMRRTSAAARHLIWALALAGVLALPALTILLPPRPVAMPPYALAGRWLLPPSPTASRAADRSAAREAVAPATSEAATRRAETLERASRPAGPASTTVGGPPVWMALWFAGALVVLARIASGYLLVQRSVHRAHPITSGPWRSLLRRLASIVGLGTPPALLRVPSTTMPMTWGVMRPAVLLPEGADTWPEARREIVLLHELAHVRRRDCLTQALAQFACAVYWFNPIVWIAARRLRAERELACDDLVLRHGATGPTYAAELLELARTLRDARGAALATVAMARRSQLEGRLLAILNQSQNRATVSRPVSAVLATALLVVLVPVAAVVPESGAVVPGPPEGSGPAIERLAAWPATATTATPAANPRQDRDISRPQAGSVVIDALIGALQDPEPDVRRAAASALGDLREPRAVEPLIAAIDDENEDVRRFVASALGDLRDRRALPGLVAALSDENADVRRAAASALGAIRDPAAAGPLAAAIKDANPDVRRAAISALVDLTKRTRGLDPDPNPNPNPNPDPITNPNPNPLARPEGGGGVGTGAGVGIGAGVGQGSGRSDAEGLSAGFGGAMFDSIVRGIASGLSTGIDEGLRAGLVDGIRGGITGGVDAGVQGGLDSGIRGGVAGNIKGGVPAPGFEPTADVKVTQRYLVPLRLDGRPVEQNARRWALTLREHSLAFTMRNDPRGITPSADPGVAVVTFTPEAGHRYEVEIRGSVDSYATRVWTKGEWKPVVRDRTTDRIVSTEPVWSGTGTGPRDNSGGIP